MLQFFMHFDAKRRDQTRSVC